MEPEKFDLQKREIPEISGIEYQQGTLLGYEGGMNRASNLALACEPCNTKKGKLPVEQFLAKKPGKIKAILALSPRHPSRMRLP